MTSKETKKNPEKKGYNDLNKENFLILHNDDIHSFEYVTDALIEICDHSFEQASQCTLITHYKGKCDIKKGEKKQLQPLREALIRKELNATID